jgi:hypothetical protein
MALLLKSAKAAICPLSGAKSGPKTGRRLSTAVKNVVVDEADYLHSI